MSLIQARNDWKRFATNGGFEVSITLTPLSGSAISIKGLAIKHHITMGTDGLPVNAKNAHVTIVEKDLTDLNYTVRNSTNEVNLFNHKVAYIDSSGVSKNYIIKETFPDETVGVITCILGSYGN